jgi:hypothetical protein
LLRQNLTQKAAHWPHTTKPANTKPATINRSKQTQTTSNGKPSIQKPPNQKPPNQKPPNQKPSNVCHGWVDINVGGTVFSLNLHHFFFMSKRISRHVG